MIVATAKGFKADLKFIKNSNGIINFGRRSQLTTVIGKKANHQVHHIIPWASNTHKIVQQAVKFGNWHPNLARNGKNLDKAIHNGYDEAHSIYNAKMNAKLNDILNTDYGGNISPKDAVAELNALADKIRAQLEKNISLDQIAF